MSDGGSEDNQSLSVISSLLCEFTDNPEWILALRWTLDVASRTSRCFVSYQVTFDFFG